MDKLKECLNWFEKFNANCYRLKTRGNRDFVFFINMNQIPHLMGLQYAYKKESRVPAFEIIKQIEKLDDPLTHFMHLIQATNPSMLDNVQDRIDYLQTFFEKLDHAYVTEKTNANSSIKSTYLVVQTLDGKILELGLKPIKPGTYVLETFFSARNDRMFSGSILKDPIDSIEVYDADEGQFIETSFNDRLRLALKQDRYSEQHPELRKDPRLIDLDYECLEYRRSEHSTYERNIDDDFCR